MANLFLIDVESTCWENNPPVGQKSDIIEIGGLICSPDGTILEHDAIYIKPLRSTISEFCTKLTGITSDEVERKGGLFVEVMRDVAEAVKEHNVGVWGSWGEYDRNMIEEHCKTFGVKNPLPYYHLNVKALFFARYGKRAGVGQALKHFHLSFEGTPHRGGDDVYNIYRLYQLLVGLDHYAAT